MKLLRLFLVMGVLTSTLLSVGAPACAEMSAQQIWTRVVQRIKSTRDYTLSYNYTGPKGEFVFEYAVVRPDQIRTRIVKGENTGAVLIYNPYEFGNQVRARKGMLGKGISLNDPKVAGTPVIQPVFDMLLEKTRNGSVTVTGEDTVLGHGVWVLSIASSQGVQHTVAVDKASFDVLHWTYTDSEGTQDRMFYDIKINVQPRIDF